MVSDPDDLLSKTGQAGTPVVGNEKATQQRVPARPRRGLNWTEILGAAGLESPGYHETVEAMKAAGRIKE